MPMSPASTKPRTSGKSPGKAVIEPPSTRLIAARGGDVPDLAHVLEIGSLGTLRDLEVPPPPTAEPPAKGAERRLAFIIPTSSGRSSISQSVASAMAPYSAPNEASQRRSSASSPGKAPCARRVVVPFDAAISSFSSSLRLETMWAQAPPPPPPVVLIPCIAPSIMTSSQRTLATVRQMKSPAMRRCPGSFTQCFH